MWPLVSDLAARWLWSSERAWLAFAGAMVSVGLTIVAILRLGAWWSKRDKRGMM